MKTLFTLFWTAFAVLAMAQSMDDFTYMGEYYDDELYLGFAAAGANISNPAAPFPERHRLSNMSAELNMRYIRVEAGEVSWRWQHKLIGDMAFFTADLFNGKSEEYYRGQNSGLSCGLLGWWNWTFNLHEPKRYLISVGANFHDYFIGSTYEVDSLPPSDNWVSLEPQGYYFAVGPTVVGQYVLNDFFIMESSLSYSIPIWRAVSLTYAQENDDYPKPHFLQWNVEAISKWGLYIGFNYNRLLNRGDLPNNMRRWDFMAGIRFRV